MVTWGIATACHAALTNKEGLYAARFFLGLVRLTLTGRSRRCTNVKKQFEAGMFPGVILQMCYWYRPDEMSIRLLFFCRSMASDSLFSRLTKCRYPWQSQRYFQRCFCVCFLAPGWSPRSFRMAMALLSRGYHHDRLWCRAPLDLA